MTLLSEKYKYDITVRENGITVREIQKSVITDREIQI